MSIITKMLKQTAVYWPPSGAGNHGQTTWGDPVEIACRWEDSHVEFTDPEGQRKVSKAVIYVDRDVLTDGVLYLGELSSSVDEDSPMANAGAEVIRQVDKLPNFKATEFLRTVYV